MHRASQIVARPMEVLMVEDSLTAAKLTGEDALEFVCRSGKHARVPRPDLILLD